MYDKSMTMTWKIEEFCWFQFFSKNGKFRQNAKVWQKYDKSMTIGRKIRQKYDILKKYDNSMTKVWQKYDYDKSMTQWQPWINSLETVKKTLL